MNRLGYMFRETFQSLRRNFLLTAAAIIVVFVSLSILGSSFLVRQAVDNATARWEGGIEFVVWMNADATPEQHSAIRASLEESSEVEDFVFVDQDATYTEFQEFFTDQPELLEAITPEDLPPSYRVVPVDPDPDAIDALASTFDGRPGVRSVVSSNEAIKDMQRFARRLQWALLAFSAVVLVASMLLMFVTILMAINARRREIEVMRLVGATNWFIRIPFMLEGLLFGIVGGLAAVAGAKIVEVNIIETLSDADALQLLQGLRIDSGEFRIVAIVLVGLGALVGMIGSGFAVSRHLDV